MLSNSPTAEHLIAYLKCSLIYIGMTFLQNCGKYKVSVLDQMIGTQKISKCSVIYFPVLYFHFV